MSAAFIWRRKTTFRRKAFFTVVTSLTVINPVSASSFLWKPHIPNYEKKG